MSIKITEKYMTAINLLFFITDIFKAGMQLIRVIIQLKIYISLKLYDCNLFIYFFLLLQRFMSILDECSFKNGLVHCRTGCEAGLQVDLCNNTLQH